MKNNIVSILLFSFLGISTVHAQSHDHKNSEQYISSLLNAFNQGQIIMDQTNIEDVSIVLNINLDGDTVELFTSNYFSGFEFNRVVNFYEGKINTVSYSTFYDSDNFTIAAEDGQIIKAYLVNALGDSFSTEEGLFNDWEFENYIISLNLFEDGYSFYLESINVIDPFDSEDADCVGDFYSLKLDLNELFLLNIANGSIKLGSTTKSQMAAITGNGEVFNRDYEGLWVSGTYTYENNTLASLDLDYFYDCNDAYLLLEMDEKEICTMINEVLGANEIFDSSSNYWTLSGQNITQMNFEDGYSIIIEK